MVLAIGFLDAAVDDSTCIHEQDQPDESVHDLFIVTNQGDKDRDGGDKLLLRRWNRWKIRGGLERLPLGYET